MPYLYESTNTKLSIANSQTRDNTFVFSGGSRGVVRRARPSALFLDQTEARRAENFFLENTPRPNLLSQGLYPALVFTR